jgi:carbamoyl-phosphate synthase large subunit
MNILVLGVGGNVSQGILKALALSGLACRVVGACVNSRAFGLYTTDKAYISPAAADPAFMDWLLRICREEGIHAILSGVEPVLKVLSREVARIQAETGAIALVSSPECLAVGDDKLATCRWLEAHGLAFPAYADSEDATAVQALVNSCGYPLLAKPRQGKGAEGVLEIRGEADLRFASGRPGYVIQEYLGSAEEEYTAACLSDRDAKVRGCIVLRRELMGGTTSRAEAGGYPLMRSEAIRIAEALRPVGPCNVQMRLHRGRAVCFEINVRFSGTTPIRARLGFNDVEAALRHYILGEPAADLPVITEGICVRYWNEAYPDLRAVAKLDKGATLDSAGGYRTVVECYGAKV